MAKSAVLAILVTFLVGCSAGPVEIPAVISPSLAGLIEYSLDGQESWRPLSQDEVKRVETCSLYVRQGERGEIFALTARGEKIGNAFAGTIVFEEGAIRLEGKGAVFLSLRLWGGDTTKNYAKIILECSE